MIECIDPEKICKSCGKFDYHIDLESPKVTKFREITPDLRIPDNCSKFLCNCGACPYTKEILEEYHNRKNKR